MLCGSISQYNGTAPVPGPYNFARVLVRRARVEGFIVMDYADRARGALRGDQHRQARRQDLITLDSGAGRHKKGRHHAGNTHRVLRVQ